MRVDSIDLHRIQSGLIVIGVEVILIALAMAVMYAATTGILSRLAATGSRALADWSAAARMKSRRVLLAAFFVLLAGVLVVNAWLLLVRGLDLQAAMMGLITSTTPETRAAVAKAFGKLVLGAPIVLIVARMCRRLTVRLEAAINRWDRIED